MDAGVAIETRQLSKRYRRGVEGARTLRDDLGRWWAGRGDAPGDEHFLALDDLTTTFARGRIHGLTGANGSGKSTLLKLLAGVTSPSAGEVRVRGRIGAMLEVGAAFDQQLTGRDNVYLFAAMLGMGRRTVARRLEAIVDFSEVGTFLDTPVKRYSSGMYMRLAFAVLMHHDAETLLLDEVFAIADLEFRLKSFAALREIAASGRTILLVSHDTQLLQAVCDEGLYFADGRMIRQGPIDEIAQHYTDDLTRQFEEGRSASIPSLS